MAQYAKASIVGCEYGWAGSNEPKETREENMSEKHLLAIQGGRPIRTAAFPSKMLGAALIGKEELKELEEVVSDRSPFRHYGLSVPLKTSQFEAQVQSFLGCKYALAVSSGTAALSCALAAMEIGVGDEVLLPAFGWYSLYSAVIDAGAMPVFAGINDTLNIDPADLAQKITPRTKAVIVIHYQGGAAQMDEIAKIARDNGVKVIEDCAQSFGGTYRERYLGTIGDIGITSFQINKLITAGEGGMLYTNNEQYYARAVRFHDLGFIRPVFREQLEDKSLCDESACFPGLQYRMGELQGAFLLAQFRKLPGILDTCRKHFLKIKSELQGNGLFAFRPAVEGDCGITVFMKFPSSELARYFAKALDVEGIPVGPSSGCVNLLESPQVRNKNMIRNGFPLYRESDGHETAEFLEERARGQINEILSRYVSIGIGPLYTNEDVQDIVDAIWKVHNYYLEIQG